MALNARRGATAGQKAVDEQQKSQGGFRKTEFLTLKPGEEVRIRLLDEWDYDPSDETLPAWVIVDQHSYVNTRARHPEWPKDSKWPEKMGSVCRITLDADGQPMFAPSCYLCETGQKKSVRYWARAVIREEVKEDGNVVAVRDKVREVRIKDKEGNEKTILEPEVVVLNFGQQNFFGALIGFGKKYGTVLDRDYWVTREGEKTDTVYHIVPDTPINRAVTDENGNVVTDAAGDVKTVLYTTADPVVRAKYRDFDSLLEDEITRQASDDHYALWFDTNHDQPSLKKKKDGEDKPSASAPSSAPQQQDAPPMQSVVDRIKSYAANADGPVAA